MAVLVRGYTSGRTCNRVLTKSNGCVAVVANRPAAKPKTMCEQESIPSCHHTYLKPCLWLQ
jgi:hypothetical protein